MPYVRELERMVHPRDGHPKVFVMIDAYIDESGIHDGAPVCVVGGFFAGKGQWRKFEQLWRKVLDRFDVPLEKFHAKNLVKRGGFFHGWSEDGSSALQTALAEAVSRYKIYPMSGGIIVEHFYRFTVNERRFLTGATLNPEGCLEAVEILTSRILCRFSMYLSM